MTLSDFLDSSPSLPSAPAIAGRILEAVRNESESNAALAQVIAADPALTARILAFANSPLYAPARPVTRVDAAIGLIGTNALKNVALSFVVLRNLDRRNVAGLEVETFMKRALTGAVAADLAARELRYQGDIFASALLRDVGMLALALGQPQAYAAILGECSGSEQTLLDCERTQLGFDHAELGYALLRKWGLPDDLALPVRHHHAPAAAPAAAMLAAELLQIGDHVAAIYHDFGAASPIAALKSIMSGKHGVAEAAADSLIDAVAARLVDVYTTFEIDAGDVKPYSQLMHEANEELRRLNLSYEELVLELKQARAHAEQLAQELREANASLREMAARDGLTGLYNHRSFQELLAREVSEAVRYHRPASLVMFDIDHFKRVNDTRGHPAGDAVLRVIARHAAEAVRACDIAARYGGEEFALILPETDAQGALILAERLRASIEGLQIDAGEAPPLRVTISAGVCACRGEPGENAARLVETTDKALYAAKKSGRNRVICVR